MAKVEMGNFLDKLTEEVISDEQYIENFLNPEEPEVDEGYDEWIEKIKNSTNPQEEIFRKIQELVSDDDRKCLEMILVYLREGNRLDIVGIENMLKPTFPDINPIAVFQYVMLLSGAGLIQMEEENA